jgi:hypothetical protein
MIGKPAGGKRSMLLVSACICEQGASYREGSVQAPERARESSAPPPARSGRTDQTRRHAEKTRRALCGAAYRCCVATGSGLSAPDVTSYCSARLLLSTVPMHGATSLYEYPTYDANVYADADMTMEVAEPATTAWTYVAPPPCKTVGKNGEARTEQVQAMDWRNSIPIRQGTGNQTGHGTRLVSSAFTLSVVCRRDR